MKNFRKKIGSFQFIGKSRKRLRFKDHSTRKWCITKFYDLKSKSSGFKFELKLKGLLLKEYFKKFRDIKTIPSVRKATIGAGVIAIPIVLQT